MIILTTLNYFRNRYQITNPKYISEDSTLIKKTHNKYSLTEGITEKIYRKIVVDVLSKIPDNFEWHNESFLKENRLSSYSENGAVFFKFLNFSFNILSSPL